MTGRGLHVLATGALALVQDLGRTGLAAVGVGRSGAADRGAYLLGNRLVGHPEHRASLEVLLGGLVVRAEGRVTVALTGAVAPATVDGRPVPHAAVVEVPDGGELRLGTPARGLRTYLAVRGGVDVEPVLGSRSTDTLSGVGPPRVVPGQRLPVGLPPATFPTVDHAAGHPAHESPGALTLMPGPRSAWIGGVATLGATSWEVGHHSDRVGVRLTGTPVNRVARHRDVELPSEGLVRGAVQLPPDGNPVVFLADHPVTGGYPVVAVLTEASVDRAAQLRPGETVQLVVRPPRAFASLG
jgi:biotin-dependent carboxylase-like uncharacterized protein